jgi:hypothetical protein
MPLVHVDYDNNFIPESILGTFTQELLEVSMDVFSTDEDHISIFCSEYGPHDRSTAAAEIEFRAAKKEFVDDTRSETEMRDFYLSELSRRIASLKAAHNIESGIIVTVTIENWKVEWIS